MKRFIIAGLAAANVALAQTPTPLPESPIDQALAKQRVADQRAEADVRQQVAEQVKLYKTYPAKTVSNLKAIAQQLDLRNDISSKTREALIAYVNKEIAGLAAATPTTGTQTTLDPKIAEVRIRNAQAVEAATQEARDVQTTSALIAGHINLGQVKQAQALAQALLSKYPNNPAVIAMNNQGYTKDAVTEWKGLVDEQNKRYVLALNDVDKSNRPIKGDMEFDVNYWKTRVLPRVKAAEKELLAPEEKVLLQSLDTKIEKSLRGLPFDEAIQALSNMIKQPIHLEKASVEDVGVDLRKPVDTPANVDARTVLRSMLQSQGLTFIIRDKMIQVVTLEKARQNLVTRAYEIRDIVQNGATVFGAGSIAWGSYLDFQQVQTNANTIIKAITGGIDPRVWKENGGPATITFHYASMSLVVRAPAEVHMSLAGSFKR